MKDKKWLQDSITKVMQDLFSTSKPNYFDFEKANKQMRELVNRLDEPEVLSEEWIERNTSPVDDEGRLYVWKSDLQNAIVPKQELPVIPKFVADWIEEAKGRHHSLYEAMADYCSPEMNQWIQDFYHSDLFAKAWLDGYVVEKNQKYILSINITDKASKTNYETFLNKRGIFHSMENESFNSEEFNWSEEEIKDMENGEILFEHFAVKVEELE